MTRIAASLCVLWLTSVAFARGAGEDVYLVVDGKTVRKLGGGHDTSPIHYDCNSQRIYSFDYPQMICTDFSGKVLWKYKLKMQRGQWVQGVFPTSPHVVCVWTGSGFTGLDKASGQLRYQVDPGNPHWTRTLGGAVYFVGTGNKHQLRRFDPGTGQIVWTASPIPLDVAWNPLGKLHDGCVRGLDWTYYYFDQKTGRPLPLRIEPAKTRRVLATADRIFHLAAGELIAYERGGRKLWSVKGPGGADRILEPFAQERLILADQKRAQVFDCTTRRVRFNIPFEQKHVPPEMWQTKDTILVCNRTYLRCLDAKTGAVGWKTPRVGYGEMQRGRNGTVLQVVWHKNAQRNAPPREQGTVTARRISDGKVLWKWTSPPFADPNYPFAGITAEQCQDRLLLRVKWHLLD